MYATVFGLGAIVVTTRSLLGEVFGVIWSDVHRVGGMGLPVSVTPPSTKAMLDSGPASRPDPLSLNVLQLGSQGSLTQIVGGLSPWRVMPLLLAGSAIVVTYSPTHGPHTPALHVRVPSEHVT